MTFYSSSEPTVSQPIETTQASRRAIAQPEAVFNRLLEAIAQHLSSQPNTHFTLSLKGENTQFTRFNGSKVRQSGQVCDAQLQLSLMNAQQSP